jgi:hypothetical protein
MLVLMLMLIIKDLNKFFKLMKSYIDFLFKHKLLYLTIFSHFSLILSINVHSFKRNWNNDKI